VPLPEIDVPVLFALTLFVSATLLFLVQPMMARMVLPLLGGTPAVWNTCMVFFQAVLLAGYAYAHFVPPWVGTRRHFFFHAALLLLPMLVLPIGVAGAWVPPEDANPIPWLAALLSVSVGLPFLVVATSAPLLQNWFSATGHTSAGDPYFLYGASNVGSMAALLGYPTLIEPFLSLQTQSRLWLAGYLLLIGLTLCCGWMAHRAKVAAPTGPAKVPAPLPSPFPSRATRWHWLALAFVPSSLMLGVTTYFTTDIAAIPLLWVVPLAIYLGSFILVFARRSWLPPQFCRRAFPPMVLCLVFLMIGSGTHQLHTGVVMLIHLAVLFLAAMVCHGELARRRPTAEHLTTFYLYLSLGGVLGGMFNALVAPLLFTRVLEYPLVLLAACLLLPGVQAETAGAAAPPAPRWRRLGLDLLGPGLVGGLTAFLVLVFIPSPAAGGGSTVLANVPGGLSALAVYVLPLLVCFSWANRPVRFACGLGALLLASGACQEWQNQVLYRERGFFGDMHVRLDPTGQYIQMVHGTTLHGMQNLDPARRGEPLTYFHRTGPIGQIFASREGGAGPIRRVGVTGLGVGVLASYARPDQHWTYYEIDPAVCRVAYDSAYFTYLKDAESRGVRLNVVLGDARLKLAAADKAEYDLLALDAFSSDSVPVHLLTRQALQLYLSKLGRGGWLIFNISNRYLNLEPVLAALAKDADLTALVCYDQDLGVPGKNASSWIVMARTADELEALSPLPGWRAARCEPGVDLWTDDFSNLLRIFLWR
jgi:hypothetical protein